MTDLPSKTTTAHRATLHPVKRFFGCALLGVFGLAAASTNACADTVTYNLNNVFLEDGSPMTGKFDWTYDADDFEGGSGEFTELVIPYWGSTDYDSLTVTFDIKNSIEFNRDSLPSTHDEGYGINLKFSPALTPAGAAMIDTTLSAFECCGNGFKDQGFLSGGSIAPVVSSIPLPSTILLLGSGLVGFMRRTGCDRP